MAGAFIISRDIFENAIWQNNTEFRLFFLIVGKAIFAEEGQRIGSIHLKKGQWLRSYRNLQTDLEYIENHAVRKPSLSTIKKLIDKLVRDERITLEQTELGTLFTVCNYCKYQDFEHYKNSTENTAENTGKNRERTESERRANNNNKEKNVKKEKTLYGEFVSMTEEERQKLLDQFGDQGTADRIERLNLYKGSTGKKYASDYLTILSWDRKEKDSPKTLSKHEQKIADIRKWAAEED